MRYLLCLVSVFTSMTALAQSPGVVIDTDRLARLKAAKMPEIDEPIPFNSEAADAIVSSLEIFPPDNPWNIPVDTWPLAANSAAVIKSIGTDKPLRCNPDMGFVLVPPNQKKVDVKLTQYTEESDTGPYPVPANTPIEGWPANFQRDPETRRLILNDVQRGRPDLDADRHGIVVDPVNRKLYEFYRLTKTDTGWTAEQASIFDLTSNKLRPDGWTSSDAAGLPIFPSIVRYDELQRGKDRTCDASHLQEHAPSLRLSGNAFCESARPTKTCLEWANDSACVTDFDTTTFSPPVTTILDALKRYGMLTADNGIDLAISIAPDERIPEMHDELRKDQSLRF
jgi:hypothetical protein